MSTRFDARAEVARKVVGRYAAALLDSPLPWTRVRRVYALTDMIPVAVTWGECRAT
jgi:hypothetical protein